MELNYDKSEWEEIPDRIRKLDTEELDFTMHGERHLHKMEMDRRLYIQSSFLKGYSWDGSISPRHPEFDTESWIDSLLEGIRDNKNGEEKEKNDSPTQPGLQSFIEST